MNTNFIAIAYMIERIQKKVQSKILLIFNYDHQPLIKPKTSFNFQFINCLLRVLLNQSFPNASSSLKITTMPYIKNTIILEPEMILNINEFLNRTTDLSEISNLYQTPLKNYEFSIISEKKRVEGILGGHRDNLRSFNKYFLKKLSGTHFMNEIFVYAMIQLKFPKLTKYTPKIYGMIIVMNLENLTQDIIEDLVENKKKKVSDVIYVPIKE